MCSLIPQASAANENIDQGGGGGGGDECSAHAHVAAGNCLSNGF